MELINVFPVQSLGIVEFASLLPMFFLSFGALGCLLVGTHKKHGHDRAALLSALS